jgi:LysR family transcriptional regulator, nitrogen assimilation regulatory protein
VLRPHRRARKRDRASEHLNVAQTALGSQIRHLEEELGVVLLQRHSRGVSVTKAGELLYRHVQIILADVDSCLREIAELRSEKSESLKFGASGSVVQLAASDLLARAHDAIPNVSITLVEDTSRALFEALKRGEVDMILAHDLPDEPGLSRTPWMKEELLFFTAGKRHGPHRVRERHLRSDFVRGRAQERADAARAA